MPGNGYAGLRRTDVTHRPQLQLGHRLFAEPVRPHQRGKRANGTNARASIMADREQQQFQFRFGASFGPSSHACDRATRLVNDSDAKACYLRTTRFGPQRIKAFSFDFAAKQGAHAGARKTKSNPVDEIG